MPLDSNALNTLTSNLTTLFSSFPASTDVFATQLAAHYKTYALNAQSCALAPPSLVFDVKLKDGIKAALDAGGTYAAVADKWKDAFDDFWTGAAFGATGAVTTIGGSSALKSGLEGLWQAQAATIATFPVSAQAHAVLLDTYTKTVQAKDTALPMPPGCGPAPIT
jgi:hypothetical protein